MLLSMPVLRPVACAALAVMFVVPALADTRLTLERNGSGDLPVDYRDAGNLRVGDDSQSNWYLTSAGERFVVMTSPDGGKRFAMNMDQFLARDDAPPAATVDLAAVTATPTGRAETVAGITGQVYLVNGNGRSWELVLTGDDTMAAVTDGVYGAEIRMARMSGQAMAAQPLAVELALAKSLNLPGILRGQLYTLADVEADAGFPQDHFRLAGDTLLIKDWKEMQDAYH